MVYRVTFVDGSEELFEAGSLGDARKQAESSWDAPIRKIVVQDAAEPEVEDNPAVEEEEDEEDDDDDVDDAE